MRQTQSAGAALALRRRLLSNFDIRIIAFGEGQIARSWHGVSVAAAEDVDILRNAYPTAAVVKVPNAVSREFLPFRAEDGHFRLLFTGNLGFEPNTEGLRIFVSQAWPTILQALPAAKLTIVGFNPSPSIVSLAKEHGFELHSNVPSLRSFYASCDMVITPITFGSGTRTKILEAMAYGRPIVSTSLGAEGMGLEHGHHLLLADTMADFAAAVVSLGRSQDLRAALVAQAHRFQQEYYMPPAINAAVTELIERSRLRASGAPVARLS